MKKTLAAITTIVIAVGLAISGVSTASANDAVAPVVPTVKTTGGDSQTVDTKSGDIPAITEAPPSPAPMASSPTIVAQPAAPSRSAQTTAPLSAKSVTPTPSGTPIPSDGKCLPATAVSYTYEPSTNSGTVIVADQQHPTAVLCNPIYITAASWNYTNSAVWPQALNLAKTNYLTVSKVGTYAFGAEVTCGQGDIYAQSNSYIIPTPTLEGPASWERFLSSLGLDTTTPGSSYMLTSLSCVHILPVTSVVTGACYWDNERGSSSKTIKIQYDNRQSNVAVDFSIASGTNPVVDNSAYDRTVAAGKVVDVTVPTSGTEGARYTVLAAGAKTNLTVASYEACPPEITTLPLVQPAPVSFLDTCGVAGDKVVIPTLTNEDHFRYSTAETTTSADVRTVTVTAVPEKGYGFGSDATTLWSHTFKTDAQSNCVTVPGDPEAVGQSCAVAADGVVSGYLTVAPVTGVGYTIHPVAPTGADITVTGSKTDVVPGDYLIIAMAEPGFILTGVTTWPRSVAKNVLHCGVPFEPPTLADLPSSVSWVGQTCSASGTVSGYIAIDSNDFLSYFVDTTQLVSARTAFAPGTYVVRVVAPLGDTIDGPSSYTATISKPGTSCGNLDSQSLTTLAFTGFDSGEGYLAVASALLMLGAGLVFTARRKAKA